jgi:hypothetical protein
MPCQEFQVSTGRSEEVVDEPNSVISGQAVRLPLGRQPLKEICPIACFTHGHGRDYKERK